MFWPTARHDSKRATYRVGVCHSIQLSYERIYEINGEVPIIAF